MKPTRVWCVVEQSGRKHLETVRTTRRKSIDREMAGLLCTWKQHRRWHGVHVVRCTLTEE